MGNVWHDISPKRITPEDFMAVIEITKGSKKKYELDKETGLLMLDRILYTSTHYPANYGFIPRTYGDDGDPLDVVVICSEKIDPMTLVRCYPIGVEFFTLITINDSLKSLIRISINLPSEFLAASIEFSRRLSSKATRSESSMTEKSMLRTSEYKLIPSLTQSSEYLFKITLTSLSSLNCLKDLTFILSYTESIYFTTSSDIPFSAYSRITCRCLLIS